VACSAGGDGGRKLVRSRIATAKSFGWAIYAAGFAIWLFGYLSAGHAPVFDWKVAIASVIPTLPWARLFPFAALLVFAGVTFAWCGFLAWLIWHLI
jgi:hypothetical protein